MPSVGEVDRSQGLGRASTARDGEPQASEALQRDVPEVHPRELRRRARRLGQTIVESVDLGAGLGQLPLERVPLSPHSLP